MERFLTHKHIVLAVTGGIAAYKSADLARRLREAGAEVRVVMTEGAKQFITPLTMQAVSGNPVHDDLFDLQAEAAMGHIELARWADAVIIAPATADCMARLAQGAANDLVTTLCLATTAPIAIAPSMNQAMWKNTLTQRNVQVLRQHGIHLFGPADGSQACGDVGPGRMVEPADIVTLTQQLFQTGSLAGRHVVITAGPTQEAIDPVRYISNASSGKMGYALATAAIEAGASVTLISGPVHLAPPLQADYIPVTTAKEMQAAVMAAVNTCDIFLSVAAVADYHCQTIATEKMAKTGATLALTLEQNPDIVASVAALPTKPFVIGFAAETTDVLARAAAKLKNKKLDMIIANQVGQGLGIGSDHNAVTVLWGEQQRVYPEMTKQQLARELVAHIATVL